MEKYLNSNNKKKRSTLYHAYELALEQPTLEEIFGEEEEDEEEEDEEEEEDDDDEDDDDDDDDVEEVKVEIKVENKKPINGTNKTNDKKRKNSEPVVNDKKRKTSVVKKESSTPSITGSNINGNSTNSKSAITSNNATSTTTTNTTTTTNGTTNGNNVRREYTDEQKIMIVKSYRVKLQRGLLNKELELTDDIIRQCSDIFTQMERFNLIYGMNLNLLKISKLHKVMKAILKLPNLEFPNDFKFHERSLKLLDSWENLITIIKSEKNEK
ncbi:unnamed protein product [[Candida] boidinii]|nr:unnamed protein product [[Candida] boidinii]